MLSLFIRSSRNLFHPTISSTCLYQRLQYFASFTIKDILHETSDETGTLITRFAKHIAIESYKFDPLVQTSIRYADFFPVHDNGVFCSQLRRISTEQLPALIIFSSTYRSNGDPVKFVRVLNDIDTVCVERLPDMNNDTLLRTLYSFLFLIPNKITQLEFYKKAVTRLVQDFSSDFPKEKFVQVCFYLGLAKRNTFHLKRGIFEEFLEKNLDIYTEQLSTFDMAIVTSSLYKTSTRITNKAFLDKIQKEILSSSLDDAILITLVKILRLQRVKSNLICNRLKEICTSSAISKMTATGLAHIFAYFAENRWDDHEITKPLVEEFMKRLSNNKKFQSVADYVRAKDLGTFLWCCSQLYCQVSEAELKNLEALIFDKVGNGEYQQFPDQLVDCCLSLWTMGLKSQALLQSAINLKLDSNNVKYRDQPKIDNRLTVLQSAAAIEFPAWVPSTKGYEENDSVPEYLLKSRENLKEYFKKVVAEEKIASASLACPIKGINIPGISIKLAEGNQKVFVEIVDEDQLLHFSQEPIALIKLREHLLTSLGYQVVHMRPHDISGEYTCLTDFIQKNINDKMDNKREYLVNNV